MGAERFLTCAIPRGIVYHNVSDDLSSLFFSFFSNLEDSLEIKNFEKQFSGYIGRKYAVAFPFARTAIYWALKLKNLPSGSEIIMPPITIKAILDVVINLGLKPVFVDIDPDTLCFDNAALHKSVTPETRAILITYLFGIVPNLDEIILFCKQRNLFVIEDFSHCLNATYKGKKVGGFGDVGIYSASSIKTLDTYGGGLLVSDDKILHNKLLGVQTTLAAPKRSCLIKKIVSDLIRNVATNRFVFLILVFPFIKLVANRSSIASIKHTGNNMQINKPLPNEWFQKYTSFQAKLGLRLLNSVEHSDRARIHNVADIKDHAGKALFPCGAANTGNVYWQLVAYVDNPMKIQKIMKKMGVDTSTTRLEKISSLAGYLDPGSTPNADYLHSNGLFIPCYPGLSKDDLKRISNVIKTAIRG